MTYFLGELIGTAIMLLVGNGAVANVLLNKTKGQNSGALFINLGWGLAIMTGVFASMPLSGAHLNPVVTLAFAITGSLAWNLVPIYIVAQFLGAFVGMTLVWIAYLPHWKETEDAGLKLAVFSTAPGVRSYGSNMVTEAIGTFVLIIGIMAMLANDVPSPIFPAFMALLICGIGNGLGGPTGWALNPARDLAPRIAHAVLPIAGKGDSDWSYAWVPVVGPIIGAVVAAFVFMAYMG